MNRFDELSGGAQETLFALFFRGALPSGDLPAKSGAAELRDRGLAETGHTAIAYQGEDYFTWLTSAGQKFCIEQFVKSHSGAPDISYMFKALPGDTVTSHEGHLCGNSIEQETLSAVLVHYLPNVVMDKASENAIKLASAVKASFTELGRPTGGYVSGKNAAPQIFGARMAESVIPASTIKLSADGERKPVSTLTIKLELDTSDALKNLDKFQTALSDPVVSAINKALRPGGSLWSAIRNR
ncbi:hypothetical protein [Klebsiella grimontii]|uniref:hypothetical protein n=1 Tax=Klebsiella grimontii TaxID=2058152 RepID=UPI0015E4DA4C|nr:hypothetical protein [Klebsiella grimontii]QLN81883.1 hypothetical protein HV104_30535 [Klebsiella grimontii]HBV2818138.1 hypothetical protein [Klebsiella pneumoniae]